MKTFGPCESKPILMSVDAFGLMEQDSYGVQEIDFLNWVSLLRITNFRTGRVIGGHLFHVSNFAHGETEEQRRELVH